MTRPFEGTWLYLLRSPKPTVEAANVVQDQRAAWEFYQALGLLNGEFANEQADAFAKRLQKDAPNDLAAQVTRAIRLTTGRVPTADEVKGDVAFVGRLRDKHKLDDAKALAQFCLLCLNANEFVYLD